MNARAAGGARRARGARRAPRAAGPRAAGCAPRRPGPRARSASGAGSPWRSRARPASAAGTGRRSRARGGAARRRRRRAARATAVIADPRRGATIAVPREVGDRRRSAGARGAVRGERGDDLVVAERLGREPGGDVAGEQAEGGVELVGGEEAQQVGGDALAQADLDAGVGLAEAREQPGRRRRRRRAAAAPIQMRPRSTPRSSSTSARAPSTSARMRRARAASASPASVGVDAAARALEQRRAQLVLEPADLVRERRLGHVQLLRGAREVPVPGHRLDASQLPELHAIDRRSRSLW